jgi:hypothetical protein
MSEKMEYDLKDMCVKCSCFKCECGEELTYEKAAVLCRVEGMPCAYSTNREDPRAVPLPAGPQVPILDRCFYYLTPGAELTWKQAAICLGMDVEVEGLGDLEEWFFLDMHSFTACDISKYRVPES